MRSVCSLINKSRQKSGFLGWGGDKSEVINGYISKLYNVTGIEIITRTRTEHMSEEDKDKFKGFTIKFKFYVGMCQI